MQFGDFDHQDISPLGFVLNIYSPNLGVEWAVPMNESTDDLNGYAWSCYTLVCYLLPQLSGSGTGTGTREAMNAWVRRGK